MISSLLNIDVTYCLVYVFIDSVQALNRILIISGNKPIVNRYYIENDVPFKIVLLSAVMTDWFGS